MQCFCSSIHKVICNQLCITHYFNTLTSCSNCLLGFLFSSAVSFSGSLIKHQSSYVVSYNESFQSPIHALLFGIALLFTFSIQYCYKAVHHISVSLWACEFSQIIFQCLICKQALSNYNLTLLGWGSYEWASLLKPFWKPDTSFYPFYHQ